MSGPLLWGYRNVSFSTIFVFSLKDNKIAMIISRNGRMGVELFGIINLLCFLQWIEDSESFFFISEYNEKISNRVYDHIIHKTSLVTEKTLYFNLVCLHVRADALVMQPYRATNFLVYILRERERENNCDIFHSHGVYSFEQNQTKKWKQKGSKKNLTITT